MATAQTDAAAATATESVTADTGAVPALDGDVDYENEEVEEEDEEEYIMVRNMCTQVTESQCMDINVLQSKDILCCPVIKCICKCLTNAVVL